VNGVCAKHPNEVAIETCTRCGDFVCAGCRRLGSDGKPYCSTCPLPADARTHAPRVGRVLIAHGLVGVLIPFVRLYAGQSLWPLVAVAVGIAYLSLGFLLRDGDVHRVHARTFSVAVFVLSLGALLYPPIRLLGAVNVVSAILVFVLVAGTPTRTRVAAASIVLLTWDVLLLLTQCTTFSIY